MYIVFKETELEDGNIKIEPLFADEDSYKNRPSLKTIISLLTEMVPEDKKDKIKFVKEYCPKYSDFENLINSDVMEIEILVRIKNNHVDKILRSGTYKDHFNDWADLLNEENKDKTIWYTKMYVRGRFIEWGF